MAVHPVLVVVVHVERTVEVVRFHALSPRRMV
jgi:hypothetical protein